MRILLVLVLSCLLPATVFAGTWSDDFSDGTLSPWTSEHGTNTVAAGAYSGSSFSTHVTPSAVVDTGKPTTATTVLMTADVTRTSGGTGFVLARSGSDFCGFFFWASNNTLYLAADSPIEVNQGTFSGAGMAYGTTFELQAEFDSSDFLTIRVDDTEIWSGTHPYCNVTPTGEIGIVHHSGSSSTWDNVTVEWSEPDGDGDGYCPGTLCDDPSDVPGDCDDNDPNSHPGGQEICGGGDEDCDGLTDDDDASVTGLVTWYADTDVDTFGDLNSTTTACLAPTTFVGDSTDCDDTNASINVLGQEVCGGSDEDCDQLEDDADPSAIGQTTWYADTDNDSFGDAAVTLFTCIATPPFIANSTDCDDAEVTTHPGAPESCDAVDSNCDGDIVDGFDDFDADGNPDCNDLDDDGDGLSDLDEALAGTNPLNADSDGDGQGDLQEVGNDANAPTDSDNDTVPDALDTDDDGDGIDSVVESFGDTDGDTIPNALDDDSDGDGMTDLEEGSGDADGDGTPNFIDTDSDGNGIEDGTDGNGDQDNDGIPDFLDVDDEDGPAGDPDQDGLSNDTEALLGTDPNNADSDNDGLDDYAEVGNPLQPSDSDSDGTIDALDTDDDGDGISTLDELAADADGDGVADPDADGDTVPNYLDEDSDGDGMSDEFEGDGDLDTDGIPDYLDLDSDDDGIADEVEGDGDVDGDGIPNAYDLDSDGDGDTDQDEGAGDVDDDGILNFLDPDDEDGPDADPDGDGLTNAEEVGLGTDPYDPDTDGDELWDGEEVDLGTDPLNEDTDDDGMDDGTEVDNGADPLDEDTDDDGLLDGPDGLGDDDEDGLINVLDAVDDREEEIPDEESPLPDLPDLEGGDCDCSASLAGGSPGWWFLLLLPLLRRRRSAL
jgi:large repetitive protein